MVFWVSRIGLVTTLTGITGHVRKNRNDKIRFGMEERKSQVQQEVCFPRFIVQHTYQRNFGEDGDLNSPPFSSTWQKCRGTLTRHLPVRPWLTRVVFQRKELVKSKLWIYVSFTRYPILIFFFTHKPVKEMDRIYLLNREVKSYTFIK